MKPMKDIAGLVVGDVTALRFHHRRQHANSKATSIYWWCQCKCGKEFAALSQSLREGKTTSCGCKKGARISARVTVHGHCRSNAARIPEFGVWATMRSRCNNPNNKRYTDWGGRGITICERWDYFPNFLEDMGLRPSPKHSIDRVDVNGNYCPENCRWATIAEQNDNRQNTIRLTHNGETMTMREWGIRLGVPAKVLRLRHYRKWPTARILETPVGG